MSGPDLDELLDAIEMIEGRPVTFTWSGQDYEGLVAPIARTEPLEDGGFLPRPDLSFLTTLYRRDVNGNLELRFPDLTLPGNNDKITIRNETFRLRSLAEDAWDDENQMYSIRSAELYSTHE